MDKLIGKTSPTHVNTYTSLGITYKYRVGISKSESLRTRRHRDHGELRWSEEASWGKWK